MDRFQRYIESILNGLSVNEQDKIELFREIKDHLEATKKELILSGYDPVEAETKTIERFGESKQLNSHFRKVFNPFWRFKSFLNKNTYVKEIFQWALSILLALAISLSVNTYAFAQTQVKQESMENTLFEGQRLMELKVRYLFSEPERGDIVIINREGNRDFIKAIISNSKEMLNNIYKTEVQYKNRLVKRIVGIPGDEIDIKNGKLYINGSYYEESYIKGKTYPNNMEFPIIVPSNHYFVLGDNRESSLDSRDLGFINIDKIEGKIVFRLWPLDKLGKI